MRKVMAVVVVVVGLDGAFAGQASAAATGTITGGTANAAWTSGHVDDISLTFDSCGSDGAPTCEWYALAGVMPAANGFCPSDWFNDGPAVQLSTFYASPKQTANGTTNSGPRDFTLNGAHGQRVCLYIERVFTQTGARVSNVVIAKLLEQSPPPPEPQPQPQPEPAPTSPTPPASEPQQPASPTRLTHQAAKRAAQGALARRFRAAWRRGRARSLRCERITTTVIECAARWRHRNRTRRARVIVTLENDEISTRIRR